MALQIEFTLNIDLDSDSTTFEKLVFEDISAYAAEGYDPTNVAGYFKITSPLGVYYTGSFATPDIDGAVSMVFDTLDIPVISTDQYLLGGYTFEYFVEVDGDSFSTSVSYTFCPPTTVVDSAGYIQDACESHEINTICSKITVENTTEYGDYTTLTQEITLSPPALTALPDVTTNSATLIYQFSWVNVAYSIYINSLVTYVTGNITVTVRVDLTFTLNVSPAKLAAQLMKCFVGFVNYFTAQAALKGGTYNLNPVLQSDFTVVIGYMEAFEAATTIAEWATAEALIPKIEAIINQYYNCNCGCDTTKPQFVDPYCGCDCGSGSGGTNWTFLATYPVVVSVVGDTVRYSLDPAWLAAINALTAVTVTSSDESVEVGTNPDYDLSVKHSLAFTATIQYLAGNDPSVTVTNVQRQGDRYVSGYPLAVGDLQVINYPHGSLAALEAENAVFLVKNFLTTPPGVEITDKLDVSEIIILNAGASATDFTQASLYRMELMGRTTTGFYFRLVDAVTGLAISMDSFISDLTSIQVTIKINQ